jgi:hypothetical protein
MELEMEGSESTDHDSFRLLCVWWSSVYVQSMIDRSAFLTIRPKMESS